MNSSERRGREEVKEEKQKIYIFIENENSPSFTFPACSVNISLSWGNPKTQTIKNPPAVKETWVQFLSQEDPLEKGMATHSSILVWRIPCQRNLAGYSPWGHKQSDTPEP